MNENQQLIWVRERNMWKTMWKICWMKLLFAYGFGLIRIERIHTVVFKVQREWCEKECSRWTQFWWDKNLSSWNTTKNSGSECNVYIFLQYDVVSKENMPCMCGFCVVKRKNLLSWLYFQSVECDLFMKKW